MTYHERGKKSFSEGGGDKYCFQTEIQTPEQFTGMTEVAKSTGFSIKRLRIVKASCNLKGQLVVFKVAGAGQLIIL
jgi:hypothetical protein